MSDTEKIVNAGEDSDVVDAVADEPELCIWCEQAPQSLENRPYCSTYCAVQADCA